MNLTRSRAGKYSVLAGLLTACMLACPAFAEGDGTVPEPAPAATQAARATSQDKGVEPSTTYRKRSPFRPVKMTETARNRYIAAWGVDHLKVSYTSSGNLIRFSYRVTDAERAKVLNAKKNTPYMLGVRSHAMLLVPVMDKVGQLRQSGTPVVGQEYWMVFSNKGNLVRPGDRVNVMIGVFHADGLVVE